MTTTEKAKGVPTPITQKERFVVKVQMYWRDHMNNYEPKSRIKTFDGNSKAEVYAYIQYYALAFGLCDVVHKGEGWGEPTDEPDMTDPTVAHNIIEATPDDNTVIIA